MGGARQVTTGTNSLIVAVLPICSARRFRSSRIRLAKSHQGIGHFTTQTLVLTDQRTQANDFRATECVWQNSQTPTRQNQNATVFL